LLQSHTFNVSVKWEDEAYQPHTVHMYQLVYCSRFNTCSL